MPELIHRHSANVVTPSGAVYEAVIFGDEREDGTWTAWIEFHPLAGGPSLHTRAETSQPDRKAVEYWAGGLEPLYLDGAFARALRSSPPP